MRQINNIVTYSLKKIKVLHTAALAKSSTSHWKPSAMSPLMLVTEYLGEKLYYVMVKEKWYYVWSLTSHGA